MFGIYAPLEMILHWSETATTQMAKKNSTYIVGVSVPVPEGDHSKVLLECAPSVVVPGTSKRE